MHPTCTQSRPLNYRCPDSPQFLHTKKTVIAFVLENHRIRDKYVQKILLLIQNQTDFM